MNKIVIDTNIIVSALKSKNGASNKLLSLIGTNKFITHISVPLMLEYEEVLHPLFESLGTQKINDILNYICAVSKKVKIYYLWRPKLKDPKDELVLELAVASNSKYILTYNQKDFKGVEKFGIEAITPKEFLQLMGVIS